MTDPYYETRYTYDENRSVVWKEIVKYLSRWISVNAVVLDIGAGYCDFINNIKAEKKIALDRSDEFAKFADKDVLTIQAEVTKMTGISDHSIDVVFASNLLEHLTDDELSHTMSEIKRVLKAGGKLILMQPNYRLSEKRYFEDPTHKKIFTDESLADYLKDNGFNIELSKSRFLPLSMKSRPSLIPVKPVLIRAYIYSPWKPFAGQMLFVAKLK